MCTFISSLQGIQKFMKVMDMVKNDLVGAQLFLVSVFH